jgi:uncharacterized protein YjbJ (UPF0337 family)
MNWEIVEGNWKQFKRQVKAQWGKPIHDHFDVIVGKRVELAAKIQEASPETECKTKEEISPRRLVLRGALVLGCSPWVPIALVGCDSKKDANSSRTAPAGAPATSADSAAPAATSKVSPASVQYQAQPKGEQKCGGCLNFIAESNTCKLVAGQVSPEGWCSLWAKKA